MSIPEISAWTGNVYLGEKIVAEWGCWQWRPNNHTMLYCPFNWDIQDKTWHFTITSWSRHWSYSYTPSYLTLNSWLKVLTIATVWAYLQTSAWLSMPWKTAMIWYYKWTNLWDPRNADWKQIFWDDTNDSSWFKFRTASNWDSNPRAFWQIWSTVSENAAASNTWHHLALTTSWWNTCRYYIDWQYKWNINAQYSPTGSNLWRWTSPIDANKNYYTLFWYVSETILEDIQRGDSDISKYVNNIKHLYWLS